MSDMGSGYVEGDFKAISEDEYDDLMLEQQVKEMLEADVVEMLEAGVEETLEADLEVELGRPAQEVDLRR